jgi:hypothetical protein
LARELFDDARLAPEARPFALVADRFAVFRVGFFAVVFFPVRFVGLLVVFFPVRFAGVLVVFFPVRFAGFLVVVFFVLFVVFLVVFFAVCLRGPDFLALVVRDFFAVDRLPPPALALVARFLAGALREPAVRARVARGAARRLGSGTGTYPGQPCSS